MGALKGQAFSRMEWNLARCNDAVKQMKDVSEKSSKSLVGTWSRKLIKKACWNSPIKTGRLRAGFYPIAISLQMPTIYTAFPNKNEGYGIVDWSPKNPSVRFGNRVPYVWNAGRKGIGWFMRAVDEVISAMAKEMQTKFEEDLKPFTPYGSWK